MSQLVPNSVSWSTRRLLLKFLVWLACLALAAACFGQTESISLNSASHSQVHTVRIEAFVRSDKDSADDVATYLRALKARTPGLEVVVHDVLTDAEQLKRLYALSKKHGRATPALPSFFSCNRMYVGFSDSASSGPKIEQLLTADVYTRATCSRCRAGKEFLKQLEVRWPAIRFQIHEVDADPQARQRWETLCRSTGQVPGLPTFEFGGQFLVGFQGDALTGKQWEQMILDVAGEQPNPVGTTATENAGNSQAEPSGNDPPPAGAHLQPANLRSRSIQLGAVSLSPWGLRASIFTAAAWSMQDKEEPPPLDLLDLQLPDEADGEELVEAQLNTEESADLDEQSIAIPWLGELRVADVGLPFFTLLVGLVDGFNPCAMWILVFLLSVLVNIPDRRKIIAIAGTFVLVSGLAYFAFMAAWLNLFVLIGIARPVQILLACMALFIGVINVKDFFAFKKGISFSIPESQKPGLVKRVRSIVTAKYLTVAIAGAVSLAVVVNLVELLCTAGLPALYTQILTMHAMPWWKNYLYLALYIVAYMFDDAMLLTVAVVTLSHHKLQENEGRWLKLVSGVVILLLGLVMLFRPDWLQLGH